MIESGFVSVKKLSENIELTPRQIYNSISELKRWKVLNIKRKIGKAGYKSPPKGTIEIEIKSSKIKFIKNFLRGVNNG